MATAFLQGLNPVLPILLLFLLMLASLFIGWWSYQYLTSVSAWKKRTLILLRSSALFLLVLLLLNPFMTRELVEEEKPVIAVYLDNSQSIDVTRGGYLGLETYEPLLQQFKEQADDSWDYRFYLFSETVEQGSELTGDGPVTNLQRVTEHIAQYENEKTAAVLFSDGIFTQGRNPLFTAQTLSIPVFTIPVGDTTDVQDVLIADTDFNRVAYNNTSQVIRIEVQQEGYRGETAEVRLTGNGELLEVKEITFTEDSGSYLTEFEVRYEEPGFYEYHAEIPALPDEFTLDNNTAVFSVEVLDIQTKILSLAFEVHPDVASVRRVIASDQQNELVESLYLGGGRFAGTNPLELTDTPELIVIHGLPDPDSEIYNWLADQRSVPLVKMALPQTYQKIGAHNYASGLGLFSVSGASSILDIHLLQSRERYSHPLLEYGSIDFRRLPPLKSLQAQYQLSALSETLLGAEFQRTETDIPVLAAESDNLRRVTLVNAFGWHRYEQTANRDISEFFTSLFTNIISWTATSPDQQNLTIETSKPAYTANETVTVRASLLNERNEPETDATIEIRIRETDGNESQTFRMRHTGSGNYEVQPGTFPEGFYSVTATAVKSDREIGTDETRFNVTRSSVELVNTKRNDPLLIQLAERTGGLFLEDGSAEPMFEQLREMGKDRVIEHRSVSTNHLADIPFWFAIVIALLAGEWILRRTASLP